MSSEVACLRQRIEVELEAMQRGIFGLSSGALRHDFIKARLERVGDYQEQLVNQIGESAAIDIICMLYNRVMGEDVEASSTCIAL